MAEIDKNQAMIDFLLTCPALYSNPIFFNFAKAKEDNSQFMTLTNNVNLQEPYIDGSVLKQYKFILITYKTISFNPIIKSATTEDGTNVVTYSINPSYPDENLTEYAEYQAVINWVKEQAEVGNYPNFGSNCVIDKMGTTSDNPVLYDVDESVSPPLVRYSITIQLEYLDKSHKLWQN